MPDVSSPLQHKFSMNRLKQITFENEVLSTEKYNFHSFMLQTKNKNQLFK